MAGLLDQIPGLREAGEDYRKALLDAFIGVEPSICGLVLLKPLTPRMWIDLHFADNPYVTGKGDATVEALLQLLWRCSIVYAPEKVEIRSQFWAGCAGLVFSDAHFEVRSYLERAWRFIPAGEKSKSESYYVWCASLVDLIASEYGWNEETILETPFVRLFQYIHRILSRKDPEYRQIAPEVVHLRIEHLERLRRARNHDRPNQ